MGGQRELRRHEPGRHVARVRSLHESTRTHGRNSVADPNCKSISDRNSNPHRDCNCYRYTNYDCHCHCHCDSHSYSYSYSYGNGYGYPDAPTYPYSEVGAHPKTSSHSGAASVTANTASENKKQTNKLTRSLKDS